jgi:phosphoglycolate phosphatase
MTDNAFKALIFDLDGTLIDSAPDVRASVNRMLAANGRRALTLAQTKDMVGQGGRVLVEKALARTGEPGTPAEIERCLKEFVDTYTAHPADNTVIFPGVLEALEKFKGDGTALAICTNKPLVTTLPVLEILDIARFFDVVSCGDRVPHRKPDGRHVLRVIDELGATRESTAMVGDSENDISAARDAGIRSVAVSFGYAHVPHAELGADAVIDHFRDLAPALSRIANSRKSA